MAQMRQRGQQNGGGGSSALPARASPSPSPARTAAATGKKGTSSTGTPRSSTCGRLCSLLHRALRLTLLLAALAGALFVAVEFRRLNAAYWFPLHAPPYTPTPQHNLMLSLGHSTSTAGGLSSILMWMHCNAQCRALLCRQWQDPKLVSECEAKALFLVDAGAGAGPVAPLSRLSDDVLLFNLTDLSPCAPVRYRVVFVVHGQAADMLGHRPVLLGQFVMGPRDGEASCIGRLSPPMLADGTLSGEAEPAVRFVFGSCLGISPSHSIKAFEYLARTQEERRTDFVLVLGDIIYADAPHIEDERAYLQIWHDPGTRALMQRVQFLGMFDDHEIFNDWSLADSHDRFEVAMKWFDLFVGARNPPSPAWNETRQGAKPAAVPALLPGETSFELDASLRPAAVKPRYYSFNRGSMASFFVLDTRQYASPPPERGGPSDPARRTKLGAVQLAHLLDWLRTSRATFKFIASPVAWASGVFKFVQDGWAAFEFERDLIFDYIVAHRITGVVLLSADLHWAGALHFKRWNLMEFTVSPVQSFGLPAHVRHDDNQELEYQSMWRNHFGEIELFGPDAANTKAGKPLETEGAYLMLNIYRYRYDEPKVVHRVRMNLSDMAPGPSERSPAQHTAIEPSPWIGL